MTRDNTNPYILTRSGIRFYPLTPRVVDINIEDVAFALSNITRYAGHTDFFSVAEHSLWVSDATQEVMLRAGSHHRDALWGALFGLLHDAAEAYPPGDIVGPVKKTPPFAGVVAVQREIESCVEQAFGLKDSSVIVRNAVHAADQWLLCLEAQWLTRPCHPDEVARLAELKSYLVCEYGFTLRDPGVRLTPDVARKAFLTRYTHLTTELCDAT